MKPILDTCTFELRSLNCAWRLDIFSCSWISSNESIALLAGGPEMTSLLFYNIYKSCTFLLWFEDLFHKYTIHMTTSSTQSFSRHPRLKVWTTPKIWWLIGGQHIIFCHYSTTPRPTLPSCNQGLDHVNILLISAQMASNSDMWKPPQTMSLGLTSASSLRPECSISQANSYWDFVTGIFQGSYLTQRVTLSSKRQHHQQKAKLCQIKHCCCAASSLAITNNCGKDYLGIKQWEPLSMWHHSWPYLQI